MVLQVSGQAVERLAELADLVARGDRDAHREIALAKASGRGGYLPQGLDEPVGEQADDAERKEERRGRRDQEHLKGCELVFGERGGIHRGEHRAGRRLVLRRGRERHADHVIRVLVDTVALAVPGKGAGRGAFHSLLWNGFEWDELLADAVGAVGERAEDHVAVKIGDEDVGVDIQREGFDKEEEK